MNAESVSREPPCPVPLLDGRAVDRLSAEVTRAEIAALERTVNYVVDDCLFAAGQAVGTRKAIEYEAVIWLRDHYRVKFLRAMQTFGDRWLQDRRNVTGVAFMLAERAVRYAGDAASIDVESVRRASVDVERYCALHARRGAQARGATGSDTDVALVAGYWCILPPV
jgi:hypothetical protein